METDTRGPSKRHGLIERVTAAAVNRAGLFVGAALLISAVSIFAASHLEIRSSLEELLPSDVPSVANIKRLVQRVGGDGTVLVLVQSLDGPGRIAAAKRIAPELAKEFLDLGPGEIRSVEFNVKPVERWYEEHWPLFVPLEDLKRARDTLKEEIRKRTSEANPLAVQLDDEEPAPQPAADKPPEWLDPKQPLPREQVAQRFARYEDGFFIHPDRTSLTIVVRPAGTSLGVDEARVLLDRMQAIVDRHGDELREDKLRVGFAGTVPELIAVHESIKEDVFGTALIVVSVVVISILAFFRDLRSTASLALAVLVAVAVTFGLTWLAIGYLNTQTAFLGAIVVGNGINYGLIYLARVRQLRWRGVPLRESCVEGAYTTARATLLASAATSVSFATLIIAANRGFRHFGFIGGIGMLLCWTFTFALVPAFLAVFEKVRGAPKPKPQPDNEWLVAPLQRVYSHPRAIAAVFAVLAVVSAALFIRQLPTVMERNLDNLGNEIKGRNALKEDSQRANEALGKSLAGAIGLMDSWEDADAFCDVIRQRMKDPKNAQLIDGCDTLSSVVPRPPIQEEKLAIIREMVAAVTDSIIRRIGDPAQQQRLRIVRAQLAAQRPLAVQEAPPTLLDRFRERDGTLGRIAAVTAKGTAKLEIAENLEAFVDAVRNVPVGGKLYDATGDKVIFADLLRNIEREGPRTTFLSFAGVCVLVLVFFRHIRTSLEVMGSLFIGVVLMCGVAAAFDLKINFFNFIVFPITFGVAVDYGANVAARVRERGGNVLRALAEVGPVIALCSWTSIVGYGSLLFSLNKALRSFGWYAMTGELTTISTALILLPALLLIARRERETVVGAEEAA